MECISWVLISTTVLFFPYFNHPPFHLFLWLLFLSQYICISALYLNLATLLHTPLSLCSSVTADLRPLSVGPLLVAPSWRTADRLGRGRRQCQLYWCRKGHTRQTGPVSAAAACYPPGCHIHHTHTYTHMPAYIYILLQPKRLHTSISGPMPNRLGLTGT